ncbi:MAG: Tol-Pal system beta propeller repeat protein TolB [Thioalkalivibrionaceae bacterium]
MLTGFVLLVSMPARAFLEVTVTEGVSGAIPVAIAPFSWQGPGLPPADDIDEILRNNLNRSGQFRVVDRGGLPVAPASPDQFVPEEWARSGAEYLVAGASRREGDRIVTEFHVYDILAGSRLAGYRLPFEESRLRRGAHRVSDIVYEEILGESGAFSAYIAYVTTSGRGEDRRYVLEVADSDGADPRILFRSSQPVMSPVWSPNGRELAYVSFENRRSQIFRHNVETGARSQVAAFDGINSAPAWSPDGNRMAMSLSKDGAPNIYVMDLTSGRTLAITSGSSIDTEPVFSPDGQTIFFTSDRAGGPQIYRVPANGGSATRLTFDTSYAAAAQVTPDGRSLIFVQGGEGRFRVARLDLADRRVTLLTNGRNDESPSVSPNGSMILFATMERGQRVLGLTSRDGRVQQRMAGRTGEVQEPAWSPIPRSMRN